MDSRKATQEQAHYQAWQNYRAIGNLLSEEPKSYYELWPPEVKEVDDPNLLDDLQRLEKEHQMR